MSQLDFISLLFIYMNVDEKSMLLIYIDHGEDETFDLKLEWISNCDVWIDENFSRFSQSRNNTQKQRH